MVREDAVKLAREYIGALSDHGLKITRAIIFGSYARGDSNDNSDIDLLLVSPDFDNDNDRYYGLLWKLTKIGNYKIEPVPVGEEYFSRDSGSPIVEIAKHEGYELKIA
ncbi:MAG TPA: nucleotidyltransferase domain-containing protein [Spirochaetota bacterium]|nr:nucleotidyltransferase domain-containing protein [Spirochaetota bacterium]HPQ54032.1 nucleotidyltransferase domain-containing protein [Spirochaetota bacterium]